MINRRTLAGMILCCAGVILVRFRGSIFFPVEYQNILYGLGVIVSFCGISVFASGLKKRVVARITICPVCYCKNDYERKVCKKCKAVLKKGKNNEQGSVG